MRPCTICVLNYYQHVNGDTDSGRKEAKCEMCKRIVAKRHYRNPSAPTFPKRMSFEACQADNISTNVIKRLRFSIFLALFNLSKTLFFTEVLYACGKYS